MRSSWFSPSPSDAAEGVVVVAFAPYEARQIRGLQSQVETMYRSVFALNDTPEDRAVSTAAGAFQGEPADQVTSASRLVFAFFGNAGAQLYETVSIVGYTRVFEGQAPGYKIICTSLLVPSTLGESREGIVAEAMFEASQELGISFAQAALSAGRLPKPHVEFMRSQFGSSQRLRDFYSSHGFSTDKFARREMTKFLRSDEIEPVTYELPDGIVIKLFDIDDVGSLDKIFAVWKLAYGMELPRAVWKKLFLEAPRLAPELSFVAWDGDTPVSGIFLEYIVEGEGGGDAILQEILKLSEESSQQDDDGDLQLAFSADYAERKANIRSIGKPAYVCSAATLPAYRGKRLARILLARAFASAKAVGLEKVFLGTDGANLAAYKAYVGAGMVQTNVSVKGTMTVAEIEL